MHHWWPHLLTFPHWLDPISWLWLSVKGYAFTSSGLQLTIPAGLLLWFRRHNCQGTWWCPLFGRHVTADGHHQLCRFHHPDVPNRRLSLCEIHERHHAARRDALNVRHYLSGGSDRLHP